MIFFGGSYFFGGTSPGREIGKTHFEIYDPVGVYESLQDVSTMKPVVQQPKASFDDLLAGLQVLSAERQLQNQIDLMVAKMHRMKRNLSQDGLAHFSDLAGGDTPDQFIVKVQQMSFEQAKQYILEHQQVFDILYEGIVRKPRAVVISDKDDELVSHERGESIEKIDLLKKSILARAFRGELGTNDPAEESAAELLKEVLAKR
jgi:type I restriction enzyme R subunit